MTARFDVSLTQGAEADLEAIHDYLAVHRGVAAAADLLDDLVKRVESLETFPSRGPVPKELAAIGITEFRQTNFGKYRMIYRIVGTGVFVSIIADGRRDMQTLLEHRLLS